MHGYEFRTVCARDQQHLPPAEGDQAAEGALPSAPYGTVEEGPAARGPKARRLPPALNAYHHLPGSPRGLPFLLFCFHRYPCLCRLLSVVRCLFPIEDLMLESQIDVFDAGD